MTSVALVGKPNSGKSLLFNRLTGMNQKVTNFPGITVQIRQGSRNDLSIFDFPGFYSFSPLSRDEIVAVEEFDSFIDQQKVDILVCVLDVNQLEASLRVALEVKQRCQTAGLPIIYAMNMIDDLSQDEALDYSQIALELEGPVLPLSAKTGEGLNALINEILRPSAPPQKVSSDFYENSIRLSRLLAPTRDSGQERLPFWDKLFLSPVFGVASFFFIMTLLFQAIFTFATPFMDGIDSLVSFLGETSAQQLPEGPFRDFVVDALWGGIGSFLVFMPQIFFLTFIIGILEDSGYLARAAMLCHRPLRFFGLSGKSFIPMLTGHACAIPAIYAARMIDSPRRRMITILILPLMGCSARLPVYAFLIAAVIPQTTFLGGLIGLQGLTLFAMYLMGVLFALIVSALISRSRYQSKEDIPFILELPKYRMPQWPSLVQRAWQSVWQFISRAGGVIFSVTVAVWILGYFPTGQLENSFLATMGQWIEPALAPFGLDWKYGVAILTSFLAREVFVGTLGTLMEIENASDNFIGLVDNVQAAGLSLASGVALLLFYAVALQCASTVAVLKDELGSKKAALLTLVGYTLAAYLLGLAAYQIVTI